MSTRSVGPYEIERELGRGGMAGDQVPHPDIPRPLALKQASGSDPEDLLRFQREGQLLSRLRHPNVVRVHQSGADAGGPYLVMDKLEGSSLEDAAREPFSSHEAAVLVRALADAVAAMPAEGVLHRDLKPDNVLLQPDGAPVIVDFGLARSEDSARLTQTGAVMGTPAHMSPEQARGAPVDERCTRWSYEPK